MTDRFLLHEKFASVSNRHPDRMAVGTKDGDISYRELSSRADMLAKKILPFLNRAGRVLICLEPGIDFITAMLAVLKAGGTYAPLYHEDPPGRIAAMSNLPGAGLLLTDRRIKTQLEQHVNLPVKTLADISGEATPGSGLSRTGAAPARPVDGARQKPPRHAYIIHTSGSTGNPKAIGIAHTALTNLLKAFNSLQPLKKTDRCALWSALHFDVSVYEIWSALLAGATLFIPEDRIRFSPNDFLYWVADLGITSAYIPPFMLETLAESPSDFSLKRMLTGVEPISEPLLCRIKNNIPGITLINGYGPAEACVCSTLYPVPDTPSRQGRCPIGSPVPNLSIKLIDAQGHRVPKGEKGEIVIRGIQVAEGYINAPGKNAGAFDSKNGMASYRTGDLGLELKDGSLLFIGRNDFQVKFRGVRIEPGEIEALLRKHPDVGQAALVVKELDAGNTGLVAYVSPRGSARPDTADIMDYLRQMLPRTMMPTAVIALDTLPVTAQGKTDRTQLTRRRDKALLVGQGEADKGSANTAVPAKALGIAKVWEAVLSIPIRSGNENFILLGGDSISAAAIMARINRIYGIDLSLTSLFEHPEFHRFSDFILDHAHKDKPLGTRPQVSPQGGPMPLMPDQEMIWLFEALYPKTSVYHIPLVFEISGDLDPVRLEKALNLAITAHPILGVVFYLDGDKVRQKTKTSKLHLALDSLDSQELDLFFRLDDPGIQKWLGKEIRKPFNLGQGPLLRAALLKAAPQRYVLCLTVHHLVFDGWSAGLFIHCLGRAYNGLADPQAADSFDPKAVLAKYRNHLARRAGRLFRQWPEAKSFFESYLGDLPAPPDGSREISFGAATCPLSLDAGIFARIKAIARQHQTTPFAVLLSIFQITLALRNNEPDQVTGIAYAGRDSMASESITGCLMNTLVVRNQVPFHTAFSRFLGQVKKTLRAVFQYKDIPFHTLQKFFSKQGRTNCIFDVLFLMQTVPVGPLNLDPLSTRHHPCSSDQANIGLTLELYQSPQGFDGWIKYQKDRYTHVQAKTIVQDFTALAALLLDCPDERLDTLTADIAQPRPGNDQQARQVETLLSAKTFPLSPMQHGMLMETLRAPQGAGCYVEQVVFDMEEEIDIDRFTAAWERVANLHETLRLGFTWQGRDFPEQFLEPAGPLRIEFSDWSGFPKAEKQDYLAMFLRADRRLGFSLDRPPAFRVALFQTGQAQYTCVWSFHHSIGDGRSMAFILGHLFQIYRNPGLDLQAPPSFRQYIAWLHVKNRGPARQFWRQYLAGFTEPMVFPFSLDEADLQGSRRQPHAMALTTGHHHLSLSPVTCRNIKTLCQKNNLSVNAFLMAAWAVLLSHYTGKTDVLFGATVSTRHFDAAHKEASGLYINTLPIRITIRPEQHLISFIADIRAQWKQIRNHDHLSLTDIHALSPIQGSTPLSEIYFAYDYNTLDEALAPYKPQISCSRVRLLERTPAAIFLTASGTDTLRLSIEYDQRKFSAKTTKQILDHFSFFLKSCTQKPFARLKDLPVLTERETELIQDKLNTCAGHLPPTSCVHQLFEIQASINSGAPAVTDGQSHYTYGQLNTLANQVARLLIEEGAGPGKRILLLMDHSLDLIAAILGVFKSGNGYVPLEPTAPEERIRYILGDCQPDFVITTSAHAAKIETTPVRRLLMDRDRTRINGQSGENPEVAVLPGHLAYIIYTSGSTGRPKGVMIEHQALAAFTKTAAQTYELEPLDRVLQFASISFDASVEEIFPTLFAGATLVIKPRERILTPQAFLSYCRTLSVSVIDLPTAYWHMIADEIRDLELPPDLRLVIIGGDAAHADRVRAWQDAVGSGVRLLNTYGPTETTVAVTWEDLSAGPLNTDVVPIGVPFASVNLSILNHFDQPCPPGVTGELFIGGPQVARGYLNRAEETQTGFTDLEACGTRMRFFKTGDYSKMLPSGKIIFQGRRDRQIKIRGFRVEPEEIEQTLATCNLLSDCALVLNRPPEGEVRITAFVVPSQEKQPDEADLKAWLRKRLPDYMIPSGFILVKALPHTPSGKVDYPLLQASLRTRQAVQDPPAAEATAPSPGDSPQLLPDHFQAGLAQIWKDILGTGEFGPEDNFFDVGGSSLTAIRLVTAVEKRFGISLPVLAVFKHPTLADLAVQLRQKDDTTHFSSVSAVQKAGNQPPVFFVAGTEEQSRNYKEADLKDHPFYTVTVLAHKTRGQEIIPMDIWEIARRIVNEILQTDANGPYIILGFCRYCLVAYEVATQLTAMGKPVARLVFIDEFWQKKARPPEPEDQPMLGRKLTGWIPKTGQALRNTLHALNKKRELFYTAAGKPAPETLQASLMESSFWKAYDRYMPMPYPGNLVVMDSRDWQTRYAPKLRSYVKGRVHRIRVKTGHDEWFEPEQIRLVVATVTATKGVISP